MAAKQRTALVTGGVQGLGAAAARALAEADVVVAVGHLGCGAQAEAFGRETGIPVFEWDVGDFDACARGVADVEEAIGPIDILVNNAGVNRDGMFHKMDRKDWDAVLRVDLGSMFNVTRQVIGGMRQRGFGRIINISSVNAAKGQAGQTNYCAAKAGVEGFTRALAHESAGKGVTVNAIAPGYADTAMVAALPDDILDQILAKVPLSRLAEPDEIGRCVRFLASQDAGFITGATLPVNGGLLMG
ncbi:acetoacetyl-CoA reductase [Ruegeria marina]|uniref:3-oxoacyl-[acyl-carrier-protein] reductase n=1 Tax=Ruegeria marina TaxID=639004 RepID=A0A1G6IBW2_9RHOB|nr:acetoacetyl-CoA reductase [Ruegeria marina]SDC03236.1 3-oxoacyl-[acyl-carrier-protein] reductase [Ruegeria marina]